MWLKQWIQCKKAGIKSKQSLSHQQEEVQRLMFQLNQMKYLILNGKRGQM